MSDTNVFGPRPRGAGFRCMHCGTEAYPLFGIALPCVRRQPGERRVIAERRRADWEPESVAHNTCSACLPKAPLAGGTAAPTQEARTALQAVFHSQPGTKITAAEHFAHD